jgi:hypothetical protein
MCIVCLVVLDTKCTTEQTMQIMTHLVSRTTEQTIHMMIHLVSRTTEQTIHIMTHLVSRTTKLPDVSLCV